MTLRELRKLKGITQLEASRYVDIPLRTYSNYENDPAKQTTIKYEYIMNRLSSYGYIDEEHGILTVDEIKKACGEVLSKYPVEYCYLFGSYAKGRATPESDVDLFVCTRITGIQFFGLIEELRECLRKKVEVLNRDNVAANFELANEIFKDGIKIYG